MERTGRPSSASPTPVLLFRLIASVLAVLQNALGVGLAKLLDVHPLEQRRWAEAEPLALRVLAIRDSPGDTLARAAAEFIPHSVRDEAGA